MVRAVVMLVSPVAMIRAGMSAVTERLSSSARS
jgi:hypothetical protein